MTLRECMRALPDEAWYVVLLGLLGAVVGAALPRSPWFWALLTVLVMKVAPLPGRRTFGRMFEMVILYHYLPFGVVILLWMIHGNMMDVPLPVTVPETNPEAKPRPIVEPPVPVTSVFGSPDPIPHAD